MSGKANEAMRFGMIEGSFGMSMTNEAPVERPVVTMRPSGDDYEAQEAFKTLRTNIDFSGENIQVVCITSAQPGDGKSTVSYNLAKAFAESGRRTLLIDADMRKSVMKRRFVSNGDVSSGLSNYLIGQKSYEESICTTDVFKLDVMFTGHFPPNPSELLQSERFIDLIKTVRKDYSIVIVDTPPIGSVIDAAVVAKVCDGIVLVLKGSSISFRLARRCKTQLEAAKTPLLGCVLNSMHIDAKGYYGRYYKKYY